jgi:2-dehydro-3-deoxyphosphogluconate aldolase/(4S)-4-hydroxy-2-oxoglutarate aldolase
MEIHERLGMLGLIPVVKIDAAKDAVNLGQALIEGGLPCAEVTFRTDQAEQAIELIAKHLPEVLLGAGTVLTIEQAERAVDLGARYIVAPGFNPKVVDWCLENGVPVIPGVATPTEIEMALNSGVHVLKFFPAQAMGGIEMLEAIAAPYKAARFIPTGGIGPLNLADFLKMPMVLACGGSWIVKESLISSGDFVEIARLTKQALEIVQKCRSTRSLNGLST